MSRQKFNKEVAKDLIKLERKVTAAMKDSALYGWALITAATPVDTGRARASWLIGPSLVPGSLPETNVKGKYPFPTPPQIRYKFPDQNHLYILNNVEYIEYLEFGTPKIEAFAMVTNAIPKINAELTRRFKKIGNIKSGVK